MIMNYLILGSIISLIMMFLNKQMKNQNVVIKNLLFKRSILIKFNIKEKR